MYEFYEKPLGYTESIEEKDGILIAIRSFNDGGKRSDYPDGTVSFTRSDGFNSTYHANGDVSSFDPLNNTYIISTAIEIETDAMELEPQLRKHLGILDI